MAKKKKKARKAEDGARAEADDLVLTAEAAPPKPKSKATNGDKTRGKAAPIGDLVPRGLFKALGEPTRVAMLSCLAQSKQALTVGDVAEVVPVDVSVVSRNLAMLREVGLLVGERQGKRMLYRVDAGEVADSLRALADALDRAATPSLTAGSDA